MRSAVRVVTSAMGTLVALASVEHGVGEVLQGNVAPEGMMILSWPDSAFFRVVGGEPAMTVVPNLLVTGILAILVSLVFLVWATGFVQRRHGGLVLILVSSVLLLVGGGFGPPLLGIILGVAATRMNAPLTWWRAHLPVGLRRFLAKSWLWLLTACLISWLMLVPGLPILGSLFGVNEPSPVYVALFCALGFLVLSILSGFAHDAERQTVAVGLG